MLERNTTKQTAVLLVVCLLTAIVAVVRASPLLAQATPSSSSAAAQGTPSSPQANNPQAPAKSEGMVWVNTDTGVYHKPGTRWYGKSKHGKYMLEADAIKAGYKPAKKTGTT